MRTCVLKENITIAKEQSRVKVIVFPETEIFFSIVLALPRLKDRLIAYTF
jgi:hypothetical protein